MKEATSSYKSINTILPYLGIKKSDYWHIDYKFRNFNLNFDYFWDVKQKYIDFNGLCDGCNIPLYLGSDGGYYYSSIFLGHFAIGAYQDYLDNSSKLSRDTFLRVSDWFVNNIDENGLWINKYPMNTFELSHKWASCLSQAKGISTLVRAYFLTGKIEYYKTAIEATKPLFNEVSHGGVLVIKNKKYFFEEYTTEKPSLVLNGHIFTLWALRDIIEIIRIKKLECDAFNDILSIYNSAIEDLSISLNLWDTGYWTKYDIWEKHNNLSSLFYHDLHIKQLEILYKITGKYEFRHYHDKWIGYRKNIFYRLRSLVKKILFRLVK